jgi:formylglycine-generating enzyme required for sulfatase activity
VNQESLAFSDGSVNREVEELYLRLANADTDNLIELAKLAGLDPKSVIQIEMVKVPDATFAIGKYPVTQKQYQAVMGVNPSHFQGNPQNPVEQVTYNDAIAFCQELSQVTGKNYRLPTESEWEYACRAGTITNYYFGDDRRQLEDYAWYLDNSHNTTHPVGQKKPNAWGLYYMHGNVWEWCEEGYMRGGSWGSNPNSCRSAVRDNSYRRVYRYTLGFRVVCDD